MEVLMYQALLSSFIEYGDVFVRARLDSFKSCHCFPALIIVIVGVLNLIFNLKVHIV